eukprot:scaffold2992_cov214-Amphora_coffeaeformis.AAC.8
MKIYIVIVFLLRWCVHAQYEHVVHDDDCLILPTDDGDLDITSRRKNNNTGLIEDMAQEVSAEKQASNVFLRGTPNTGVLAEDDRNRYRSTPSPPPFRDTIFNFGSYTQKLPSATRVRHPAPYYHKNNWNNVKGYSKNGKHQKKGARMKVTSMKQKSSKKKSSKKKSWKKSRNRFRPSEKTKSYKKGHAMYWWEKQGDKSAGNWMGKGNPSKGNWNGKGKGTWLSTAKTWKGKGKGKGQITDTPTFAPTKVPTETPSALPSVTARPSFTATPTNLPTSAALIYLSVTGEDRTIQLQGNGGAEGAANPRLKVDREGSEQDQVVIKFTDLDNIPTGATIVSAFLTVEVTVETQRTINWHRLLLPWEESTVNGRYFGSGIPPINSELLVQPDGSEALAAPSARFVGSSDVTIDLTEDVQFWVDNPGTNNGWVIIADENDPGLFSEWGIWGLNSSNNAPALLITYIPA